MASFLKNTLIFETVCTKRLLNYFWNTLSTINRVCFEIQYVAYFELSYCTSSKLKLRHFTMSSMKIGKVYFHYGLEGS